MTNVARSRKGHFPKLAVIFACLRLANIWLGSETQYQPRKKFHPQGCIMNSKPLFGALG